MRYDDDMKMCHMSRVSSLCEYITVSREPRGTEKMDKKHTEKSQLHSLFLSLLFYYFLKVLNSTHLTHIKVE